MKTSCFGGLVFSLSVLAASLGAQIQFQMVDKSHNYVQTDIMATENSSKPYDFKVNILGKPTVDLSTLLPVYRAFSGPYSGSAAVYEADPHGDTWRYTSSAYGTADALNLAYNNGIYLLNATGTGVNVTLGVGGIDAYPTVPYLTGLSMMDFDGLGRLKIDLSLSSYTFNFPTFAEYSGGGHMEFSINGVTESGTPVSQQAIYVPGSSIYNQAAFNTYIFHPSASNMVAGQTYSLDIQYEAATDYLGSDLETYSFGLFTNQLSVQIIAVPEPSTYAAILGAVACLGVAFLRRRRAVT